MTADKTTATKTTFESRMYCDLLESRHNAASHATVLDRLVHVLDRLHYEMDRVVCRETIATITTEGPRQS